MRQLDDKLSTDAVPAHTFTSAAKLKPGEVVELAIELTPIGLSFEVSE